MNTQTDFSEFLETKKEEKEITKKERGFGDENNDITTFAGAILILTNVLSEAKKVSFFVKKGTRLKQDFDRVGPFVLVLSASGLFTAKTVELWAQGVANSFTLKLIEDMKHSAIVESLKKGTASRGVAPFSIDKLFDVDPEKNLATLNISKVEELNKNSCAYSLKMLNAAACLMAKCMKMIGLYGTKEYLKYGSSTWMGPGADYSCETEREAKEFFVKTVYHQKKKGFTDEGLSIIDKTATRLDAKNISNISFRDLSSSIFSTVQMGGLVNLRNPSESNEFIVFVEQRQQFAKETKSRPKRHTSVRKDFSEPVESGKMQLGKK